MVSSSLFRELAARAAAVVGSRTRDGGRRARKGVVYFVTSDKNIQAVRTAAAFSILDKSFTAGASGVSLAFLNGSGVAVSTPLLVAVAMCWVWWLSSWADAHTDEWREMVESATGEEVADDDATEE